MIAGCIQTYTGKQFFPLQPRLEDIAIEDIAHALALQCRFGGHLRSAYSVAQHCCHVADLVPPADRLWALLHDASEAYLIDIPAPLKVLPAFETYRASEALLQRVIYHRFGLTGEEPDSVRHADLVMLVSEAYDLLPGGPGEAWPDDVRSGGARRAWFTVSPWSADVAEAQFLKRFEQVRGFDPKVDPVEGQTERLRRFLDAGP